MAASGFFTDSYNLFSSNVILPALAYVYWPSETDGARETQISAVTLAGSAVGQFPFGVLADRYGRKRLYGVELILVIAGTIGLAQSSSGYNGSMDILGWLLFYRILIGCGIGAEYPLSATITAECAVSPSD